MDSAGAQEKPSIIGPMPYRLALAGGWIDQPFISRLNPSPPGSMVVVSLEPAYLFMDRCGMATSTRKIAQQLWPGGIPAGEPAALVRELYAAENAGRRDPSGAQDMAGLIYPGVSRLDFDASFEGGVFPVRVASCRSEEAAHWLEEHLFLLPVTQRSPGYNPLGIQRLDPEWIRRLGQAGRDCFAAIQAADLAALGETLNETMRYWEALLPQTVRHPQIPVDLTAILEHYQARYPGAMYSGCGGGYLVVASAEQVPGGIKLLVRV